MRSVCVLTCTYNQQPELLYRSVQSSLDAGADQVVLVDDGSDEPVENVWGDDRVKIVRIEHRGIPGVFNETLRHLGCELTARCPSDDEMDADKIARQRSWMERMGWRATFHDHRFSDGGEHRVKAKPADRAAFRAALAKSNQFAGSTTMVETDLLREFAAEGGYPADLHYGEDWYLANWIEHRVGWEYIPEVLVTKGRYSTGYSANANEVIREDCRLRVREVWAS